MPFIKGAKQWGGGWIIHRCPSVRNIFRAVTMSSALCIFRGLQESLITGFQIPCLEKLKQKKKGAGDQAKPSL